jgi:hypothetical protein
LDLHGQGLDFAAALHLDRSETTGDLINVDQYLSLIAGSLNL